MRQLRILFLTPNLCSGGAERQMVTVACLLKNAGYDVTIYCYDTDDFYANILSEFKIPIVWELEPYNYFRRIIKVRRYIRKNKFDAVISYLPVCNFLNDIAAIGGKSWKIITGERSALEAQFQTRRGRLFAFLQKYSDYIICNSENAKSMWMRHYPEFEGKLEVIYNTVTLGKVQSNYVPKVDGKLHIIVVATYQYLKNPIGLIKSLMLMDTEEQRQIHIDWYGRKEIARGDTKAYDETRALIEQNGLNEVISLHEDTNEIADKMNQADVAMLLSEYEGLPNVICEAMTLGKPIIMSKVSDYKVLVDQLNGILCDSNDIKSIKESIISMTYFSKDELLEMGRQSKKKAEYLFSKSTILNKWERIIN